MLLSIFYYVLIIHIKILKNIPSNFLLYTINTYKKIKLNKYKYNTIQVKQIQISLYHVSSVVSQFGFWRHLEVVGANVEKSYISLKLKPKVTLFKAFQSMAIFACVLPSARHFGDYQDATAMQ